METELTIISTFTHQPDSSDLSQPHFQPTSCEVVKFIFLCPWSMDPTLNWHTWTGSERASGEMVRVWEVVDTSSPSRSQNASPSMQSLLSQEAARRK